MFIWQQQADDTADNSAVFFQPCSSNRPLIASNMMSGTTAIKVHSLGLQVVYDRLTCPLMVYIHSRGRYTSCRLMCWLLSLCMYTVPCDI